MLALLLALGAALIAGLAVSGHAAAPTATWVWPACDGPEFDQSAAELARGACEPALREALRRKRRSFVAPTTTTRSYSRTSARKRFGTSRSGYYHYDPITRASRPFGRVSDGRIRPGTDRRRLEVEEPEAAPPRFSFGR